MGVVGVVTDEIIFNIVLQIRVVSVVNDELIFNAVFQIGIVSVLNDEIIINAVLQISVVSVVDIFNPIQDERGVKQKGSVPVFPL